VVPIEIANASVIRFEYSPEKSSCLNEGSSPVLETEIVGIASSSFTPGSSMASVAGKKRLPTISWAALGLRVRIATASPDRLARASQMGI
jgi:hypothetical protein